MQSKENQVHSDNWFDKAMQRALVKTFVRVFLFMLAFRLVFYADKLLADPWLQLVQIVLAALLTTGLAYWWFSRRY